MRLFAVLSAIALLTGCADDRAPLASPPDGGSTDGGSPAPVTTANPPGESHTGALAVTLTSVPSATIKYTTDGSDPTTSSTSTSGTSPVVVTLEAPAQVTLRFFAVGTNGPDETPHTEHYTLVENLNPASISGRLFVPSAMLSGSASVVLYSQDPRLGSAAHAVVGVQTLSPRADGAPYHFDGLEAGRYWVGAGWWPGAPSGDPVAYGIARLSPSSVDPAVTANERVDFVDVYVGECDPAGSGVDGTVTLATNLASQNIIVAAYPNAPTPTAIQGTAIGYSLGVGSGTTRNFALCGLNPGSVYLLAGAGSSMSSPGNSGGIYSAYAANPVSVTQVAHINIPLGDQDASLGSISGTLHLNGGFVGGTISIVASVDGAGGILQQPVQTIVGIDGSSSKDYPYALKNLPAGTYNVAFSLKTADDPTLEIFSQVPEPITIAIPGSANATQNLTGSVGRVDGTLTLTNPPASGLPAAIAVTPLGSNMPAGAKAVTLAPGAGGAETATFSIFGLPDGTFSVGALIDTNHNSDFADDLRNSCGAVAPSVAVISQGGTVTKDVSVTLPAMNCP